MIRKMMLLKSYVVLCTVMGIFTEPIQAEFNKANAIMNVPGKKSVMVEVNETTPNQLTFKYKIPDAELITLQEKYENNPLTRLYLGNAPLIGNEGEPVLPVIPAQFIIPAGKAIASINIQRNKRTILNVNHFMEFGKAKIPILKNAKARQASPKGSIYQKDDGFPTLKGALVNLQEKRGVKIAFVNINPAQYFPKSGKVHIFQQIELIVNLTDEKKNNYLGKKIIRKEGLDPVKMGIENPDALDSYQPINGSHSAQKTDGICNPVDEFRYIFITGQAFRDAKTDFTVNDIIAHRRAQGLSATVVTIEDIVQNYQGIDDAEKVRNFIIDAYNNWEAQYVVLGGDVSVVPYRDLYTDASYIPSDMYFQCLDGSYNDDGDMYWGEPDDGPNGTDLDLMSEVSVGRISAETPEEMANAIYKILAYEKLSVNEPYLFNACIAGEYLGTHFGPGEFRYATPYMEEIRLGSEASGYSTKGFNSFNFFTADTVYDNPDFEWGTDSIIKLINSANYSIINHLGHANEEYVMKFNNYDADLLKNTHPLFLYSQGCYPGHFPVDCIAEHLTTSNRSGMFAAVLNTVYGYGAYNDSRENLDAPSQRFDRQFWDAFFNEFISRIGDINADSHEDNIWCINTELIRYCMYETVLFGDPYTKLHGLVEGPSLVYYGQEISDIHGGNNDHICNPGESIYLAVKIQNIGSEPSANASCSLSGSDQYVTIRSANSELPAINSGELQTTSSAFKIDISADCPTPYRKELSMIIKGGDSAWTFNVPLHVYRSSTISGTVIANTGGEGISGAKVCYTGPMSGSVITGSDGSFLTHLIEGSYSLWVNANSFLGSDTLRITIPPAAVLNIKMVKPVMTVEPSKIVENLKFNDTSEVSVIIGNSGDALLNVRIGPFQETYNRKSQSALRIPGNKKKSNLRYMPEEKSLRNFTPAVYHPGKKLDISARVLYLTTILGDSGRDNFTEGLRSIPSIKSLDVVNGEESTPNLDFMLNYDCIIVSSNYSWADPELLGETLADYVDYGHLVIFTAGTFALGGDYRIKGRIASQDYMPIIAGYGDFNAWSASEFYVHEITTNVNSLQCVGSVQTSSVSTIGEPLGLYDTWYETIIGSYNMELPVVAINVFPHDGYWSGDLIQMISNCIQWNVNKNWFNIESGRILSIAPGSSESITAKLNSFKLYSGLNTGEVSLIHNDPSIVSPFIIPVELTVDGFRSIIADSTSISFNEIACGYTDTKYITFYNKGNERTSVYSTVSDNESFYCSRSVPFMVKPGRSVSVPFDFKPSHTGHFTGTIIIQSDAEDNNNISIQLTGDAVEGPKAVLEPNEISFSFQPKDSPADKTIVLSNAGALNLNYSIQIIEEGRDVFQMNHSANAVMRKNLIYNDRNYKHPFIENTVIVGLKKGSNDFAFSYTLAQAGVESVTELAKGINPVTRKKSFSTRTLLKIRLYEKGRNAVFEAIKKLSKDPNVEYAEPDYIVKAVNIPNDPYFYQLYAMNNYGQTCGKVDSDIDAVEAWDTFTGNSKDIVIGVIDTGIDYLHPDLIDNIWKNPGEIPDDGIDNDGNGFVDDVYGWDFANDDNNPMDQQSHGTHCCGTIAAKGNNGIGIAGVMWNARVMVIRLLDDYNSGSISDAIDAINYANIMNVPIINNSWSGSGYSQSLEEIIASSGIFVAAAGNNGSNNDNEPDYPSSYELDNIIAVAATDHNDDLADFSNFGAKSVDLCAPGVNIWSTSFGGSYVTQSGTSIAAAHVCGAIGLLWSNNPYIGSLEIKNAILKGVDTLTALKGKTVSGGRLNVQKLGLINNSWISLSPPYSGTIEPSSSQEFTVTVNPEKLFSGTHKADIVFWTDDPFSPKQTVNIMTNVAGCKSLNSSDNLVDFGKIWEGRDTIINIMLVNECNERVTVSECAIDNHVFSTSLPFPVTIGPFRKIDVPVRFSPLSAGSVQAIARFTSDAQDNPSLSVNLQGICIIPPKIEIIPQFINKTIKCGAVDTSIILIENSGGADFDFRTDILVQGNPSMGDIGNAVIYITYDNRTILKLNPLTGTLMDTIATSIYIHSMAFDGEYIYFTSDTCIVIFDPLSKKILRTIVDSDVIFTGIAVSNDYIIVGNGNGNIITVMDKMSGTVITSWPAEYSWDFTYSGSRNTIFLTDWNNNIVEHDLLNGTVLNTFSLQNYVLSLGYSNSAGVLFALTSNNNILAINPGNGIVIKTIPLLTNYQVLTITSDEVNSKLKWINMTPVGGVVLPDNQMPITANFSSKYLLPENYSANILLSHAPGILPSITIPCTLSVAGEKRMRINPESVEFNQIWKDRSDSIIVYLVNDGNEAAKVSSIQIKNTIFSTTFKGPVTVNAFDSVAFQVRCTPVKTGTVKDVITITSNSDDNPIIKADISATTVKPPKIKINPSSLSATMLPGQEAYYSINLKNSGEADYPYNITAIIDETGNPNSATLFMSLNDLLLKIDPLNGTIIDTILSDVIYCLAFDGKFIYLGSNNFIKIVDPGKKQIIDSIPFEDSYFTGIAVTDDKLILQFERNVKIFDKHTGELIYGWDYDFYSPAFTYNCHRNSLFFFNNNRSRIEERSISDGSLISFFSYSNYPSDMAYSSSLRMLVVAADFSFDYLDPENGELLRSFDHEYGSGVIFAADEAGSNGWLKTSLRNGVIEKNSSTSIEAIFNSSKLMPGEYLASIIIEHPEKIAPGPFVINCKLKVKAQKLLSVIPENLDFGSVSAGYCKSMPIELINDGNDTTTIKKITSSSKEFRFEAKAPVKIPPFSQIMVNAVYAPINTGLDAALLTIKSNASNAYSILIDARGTGVPPAIISIDPSSVITTLQQGTKESRSLSLTNTGGTDYAFNFTIIDSTTCNVEPGSGNPSDAKVYFAESQSIYQVNPINGQIIGGGFSIPSRYNITGLAYDWKYLYASVRTKISSRVHILDPDSGTEIGSFVISGSLIRGLGVGNLVLACMDYRHHRVIFYDKHTYDSLYSWSLPYTSSALALSESRNTVFVINDSTSVIEEREISDGTVINKIELYERFSECAFSEKSGLLFLGNISGELKVVDPDNGRVVHKINLGHSINGLAADEGGGCPRWLFINASDGIVKKNDTFTTQLNIDAEDLPEGIFSGAIIITPKEEGPGPFTIPCNLTVESQKSASR